MNKQEIIDAYVFLKESNHSIPDATLNFMLDVSVRELKRIENGRTCFSCVHDGGQAYFPSGCTGCGVDGFGNNEFKNFKIKT